MTRKYAKRGPVIMPVECPSEVVRWLAGDPVILAASDELMMRTWYDRMRAKMKAAQERKRK